METTAITAKALERGILQTLLYSDLFDFPLTPEEVAHYLIGVPSTADEVRTCLARTHHLAERIIEIDGYLALRGREALIVRRLEAINANHIRAELRRSVQRGAPHRS